MEGFAKPEDVVRTGYDAMAERYLEARIRYVDDTALVRELDLLLPEGAWVLDAGCGTGVPVARTLAQRHRVTGIDFSRGQLDLARKLSPGVRLAQMSLTALGFRPGSFDAVVSFFAIIHVPRDRHAALLRELWTVLKPGGLALMSLGSGDDADDRDDFFGQPMYWSSYDVDTSLRLVREAGFEVLWSRMVPEQLPPGGGEHLFVMGRVAGLVAPEG